MTGRPFDATMTVGDALANHPHARWVFAAYHIGGCDGCSRVDGETLLEVTIAYELPLDRFLNDLNSLFETGSSGAAPDDAGTPTPDAVDGPPTADPRR